MRELIRRHRVIAILRDTPDDELGALTDSLYRGGVRAFEVSFSSSSAAGQLRRLCGMMPEDAVLGAGTILSAEQAGTAMEAGAAFLLSPSADDEVLRYCRANAIPFMPGVYSPSDVSRALRHGFDTLKLFPAQQLGTEYLKSLKGPFPQAEFVAVGGISPDCAGTYLEQGFIGVGIGGSLVRKELQAAGNWEQIAEETRVFMERVGQYEN